MTTVKILGQQELPNIRGKDRPPGATRAVVALLPQPGGTEGPHPTSTASSTAPSSLSGAVSPVSSAVTTGRGEMELHTGFSDDGLHWDITLEPLEFGVRRHRDRQLRVRL